MDLKTLKKAQMYADAKNSEANTYADNAIEEAIGVVNTSISELQNTGVDTVARKDLTDIVVNVQNPPNGLTKAMGDGTTNDTVALQAILDYVGTNGGGTVYFPKGTYMVYGNSTSTVWGGLIVRYDNTYIVLSPNATIKVITNNSERYDTVTFYNMKNGGISGGNLEGDRITHDYSVGTTHEHGFGVRTDRAENITIQNMVIKNYTGDCILIWGSNTGSTGYYPSKKIKILNNVLDMSRRNNISVVVGQDILINGNTITNAGQSDGTNAGTDPKAGIDVEGGSNPWRVTIANNIFKNNLGGSIILYNGNEIVVDGNISDSFIDFQLSSNVVISNNELRNLTDSTHTAIEQTVTTVSANTSGTMIAVGSKYVINTRATLDFTTIGAADNNPGTMFVATGPGPLGTGDSVTRQLANVSIVNNQISGFKNGISTTAITRKVIISGNTLKGQSITGIYVVANANVTNNTLYDQAIGIRADGANNIISENVIDTASNRAIYCIGASSSGKVKSNTILNFTSTLAGAIDIASGSWGVANNVLDCGTVGPPQYAIFSAAAGTSIVGNTIIGGTFSLGVIRLTQKATVLDNRIIAANAPNGIYSATTNASNSIVSRNYVELASTTGTRKGILFSGGGTGVSITNNEIHNKASTMTNSIDTSANTGSLIARNLTTAGSGAILSNAADTVAENLSY